MRKLLLILGVLVLGAPLTPARGEEGAGVAPGVVVPVRAATLAAGADGAVQELRVEVGDRVEAGQALAAVDPRDAELAVRAAELELRAQQVVLDLRRNRIRALEATAAERHAELLRVEESFKASVATPKDLGESREAHAQARSAVDTAKLELQLEELVARRLEVGLESARLALERTRVVAPFEGVVDQVHCAIGETLRAGESPVVTLIDVSRLLVTVAVRDETAWTVQAPVRVRALLAGEEVFFEGRVVRVAPSRDAETGGGAVWVALDEEAVRRLRPGQGVLAGVAVRPEEDGR